MRHDNRLVGGGYQSRGEWEPRNPPSGGSLSFKREQPQLQLAPGNLFTRSLTAKVIAHANRARPQDVAAQMWPNDRMLAQLMEIKATSAPAMTTVSGWALEIAYRVVADTVEALGAASSAIDVMDLALKLAWDGAGSISVPALVASAANGGFVAEGDPIPVRQLAATGALMSPKKVASIAVLTREMMEGSNAEALISDTLVKSAALAIDTVFFGSAAATAAAPAGIRNGISTLTASNNADPFAAFSEDMATLINSVGAVGGKGPFVLVANAGRATGIEVRYISESRNVVPIISSVAGNDIIAVAPKAIAVALSVDPDVETADTGTLVMDTAPVPPGSVGPERSLFQTDSLAIKIRWPVSWVVRDVRGVAWLTPAWK